MLAETSCHWIDKSSQWPAKADPELSRVPYCMILELVDQNAALVERMAALEARNVTDGRAW